MSLQSRFPVTILGVAFAIFGVANVWANNDDPPDRAARLSYTHGVTSFSPAGENEWVDTVVNRPLVSGDRLWTDRDGRAELEVGGSALRLDANTSFELVNLDDQTTQVEITQGTLNVSLRQLPQGQTYEVDTPTMAVTLSKAGQYRIEVDADGQHTTVAVAHGSAQALGENATYPLQEGDRIRFHDTSLRDAEQLNASAPDDFDRFSAERDQRAERRVSIQYVGDDVVGASDLDEYGSWSAQGEYGHVWYPSHVESNWAPYSDGHWIWQDPWGWTWVDNAPWGFAPSHYGRWVSIDNRWGWVPGPRAEQAVYAPALVAFIGGAGFSVGVSVGGAGPIGWFPLGAREIYEPSYHASRDYFTRVNVTNTTINNTTITNVYNNYSSGQPLAHTNYVNRVIPGAVTAVPGNVFASAQPVRAAAIKMDSKQVASAQVTRVAAVAPSARSVIGNAPAAKAAPSNAVLERKVVARTAPPPKPVPFAARQQELQRTPGRPLTPSAVAALQPRTNAASATRNVRVLGPQAGAANARTAGPAHAAPALEPKAASEGTAAAQPKNASASDQKRSNVPTPQPAQQERKRAEPTAQPERTVEQKRAEPAPQPGHKANPVERERAEPTAERKAAPVEQKRAEPAPQPGHKANPVERERAEPTAERKMAPVERQRAEPTPQPERKAAPVEREHAVPMQERKAGPVEHKAEPAPQPERKANPVERQRAEPTAERKMAPVERQRAEPAPQPERKAAPVEREHAVPMQERKAVPVEHKAEPASQQETKAAPVDHKQSVSPSPPQHTAPPAPKKAKDNKKDESKDADKKDGGGNRE